MNIPALTKAQAPRESRRSASGQTQTTGISFQDQLVQTSASAVKQSRAAGTAQAAAVSNPSSFMKDSLLSSLFDFKTAMLDRMQKAKENEEEQEAWDKLMKYLDAWIESLREEADIEKISRAHAALTALQSDAGSDRKDLAGSLLEQLTQSLTI